MSRSVVNPPDPDDVRDDRPRDVRSRVVTGQDVDRKKAEGPAPVHEIGGRHTGLDPTRYGDWEKAGRCIDF